MAFLYLAGEAANHILSASGFSSSSSEDSLLPWSNLSNPQAWYAGRFNTAGLNDFVHADFGGSVTATFCSVHFHNIDDGITVELRRGASGGTLVATMTKQTPAFHATFNSASDTDWRLTFSGTNSSAIYVGKWVLGEHSSLGRLQDDGWQVNRIMDQQRVQSRMPPKNLTKNERRVLSLDFKALTTAQRNEMLTLFRDGEWGHEPVVVVPDDNDATEVLYGRTAGQWGYERFGLINVPDGEYVHTVAIEEDPFPVVLRA